MSRLALVLVLALAAPALAHPPPPPPEIATSEPGPTLIEWTTWLRGAVAVARGEITEPALRTTTQPIKESDRHVAGAAGIGFTLPAGRRARIGAWAEVRRWDLPLVGGELTLIPGDLDMFFYKGKSAITLRAGGNPDQITGQLGFAYRAPWDLFGAQSRRSRYMIGVGVVATATQSRHDPHDWSATIGLELEPLGALRYLLGVRSWY